MSPDASPPGRLVVCPTPIGNLRDITLRVLDALGAADILACEDTRRTRVLLERHGIVGRQLVSFHEHNEAPRAQELVARMQAGLNVALVSDAGTPLLSDPGFALVRAALAAALAVEVLPGPSAVLTALVASGLPGERFRYVGFLPRRGTAGRSAELERVLKDAPDTLVAFESPGRLAATLAVLAELDAERPVVVCRELTKLHEEVRRGSATELAAHYSEHPPRGELVLVIGASSPQRIAHDDALAALHALIDAGARPRPAAKVLAGLTGIAANELYRALTSE
jgi:16S rRNA (cytidine1402-2'-O)-methyltransferase